MGVTKLPVSRKWHLCTKGRLIKYVTLNEMVALKVM